MVIRVLKAGLVIACMMSVTGYAAATPAEGLVRSIIPVDITLVPIDQGSKSAALLYDLYSGLVTLDRQNAPASELATDWKVSDDGLTWTFSLREDALWSDGVPVTAWDFVSGFRMLKSKVARNDQTSFYQLLKNGRALNERKISGDSRLGVRALGRYTLELELEEPVPDLLIRLANAEALPVPEHAFSMYGDRWWNTGKVITNGPYLLGEQNKTGYLLKRNPRYFNKEQIAFDEVRVIVEDDQNKLLRMFQAGEIDIVEGFDPRQREWLKKYHPDVLYEEPANGLIFLYTSTDSNKMADARVRRAISLATDQRLLADRIYKTMNPVFCFVPFQNNEYKCLEDDSKSLTMEERLAEARELMAQAGHAKIPLEINLLIRKHPGYEYATAAIINIWKRINIDATAIFDDTEQQADITLSFWSSDSDDIDSYLERFQSMAGKLNDDAGAGRKTVQDQKKSLNKNRLQFRLFEQALAEQQYFIPVSRLYWRHLVKEDIDGWGVPVLGYQPSRRLSRKE